jgi:hypothetical protein
MLPFNLGEIGGQPLYLISTLPKGFANVSSIVPVQVERA